MTMVSRRKISLGSGTETFPEGTHLCLIYGDDAQRREALGRFLALGLASGERVRYFADTSSAAEVTGWLHAAGVPLPPRLRDDSFAVLDAADVYYPTGVFSVDDMLARLGGAYEDARQAGFTGARVSGEMTWSLRAVDGAEHLLEYETRINEILDQYPVTPVCQYDARRFDGATLLEVLRVHPMMLVDGAIVRNPYYRRPEELLEARA